MPSDGNARSARANVGDAIGTAIPIDLAAEHINSDVLSALARWRDVDQFSLHDLAGTLWTKSGEFAPDSEGYLRALHGFVAEKVAFDDLVGSHQIMWPEQTNVPALDMLIDGTPVQIKEGTSAYKQAQHALSRYPDITSFVTDPLTAQKLREHGVHAVGVDGLDPDTISSTTQQSLLGLDALERAGQVHVPILTTVFSLCKYWERFDAGQIDAKTAAQFAATDVAAQSIGAAAGLKLAAVYVVATGGFGIAALPLTAGAILGAMGLRYVINKRRGAALRESLELFVDARAIAEMAAETITDLSREYSSEVFERAKTEMRQQAAQSDSEWAAIVADVLGKLLAEADVVCRDIATFVDRNGAAGERFLANISAAASRNDFVERYAAFHACIVEILSARRILPPPAEEAARQWLGRADRDFHALHERRSEFVAAFSAKVETIKRDVTLELFSEYVLLLTRLTRISSKALSALDHVRVESEKLGVIWQT